MAYRVRSDIPPPKPRRGGTRHGQQTSPLIEAILALEIDQCLDVPGDDPAMLWKVQNRIRAALWYQRRENHPDIRFTTKIVRGENLVRVWRLR